MKFSGQSLKQEESKRKTVQNLPETTKLMIRNLPFEASRRELQELFRPFGQIKRITIPKKVGNDHNVLSASRGFAFVEFVSKQEAANAYTAVQNTHLYGRHLVIEYAKDHNKAQHMSDGQVFGKE